MSTPDVVVCGAGLCGSLLGLYLAKRDIPVTVIEKRPDIEVHDPNTGGRSINLAISKRGLTALEKVGLAQEVIDMSIPMYGRALHLADGSSRFLPYSHKEGEAILSVSRGALNQKLARAAREAGASFRYECPISSYERSTGTVVLEGGERLSGCATLAADGAFSRVRNALVRSVDFNFSQQFLSHRYKELTIPAAEGDKVAWRLDPHEALHIWPRGTFMLIGLPNVDGSFTMTLFAPKETFEQLQTPEDVTAFFEREFADAVPLMPTLTDDFFANPTGPLLTIQSSPWNARGPTSLLGDAAHAIVPFFGQGMNCALEDVRVLGDLLDEERGGASAPDQIPWDSVLHRFSDLRVPDAHAIAAMALENYVEMRDTTASDAFGIHHQLEHELTRRFGAHRFLGRYERVSFTNERYSEARANGKRNVQLLHDIAQGATSLDEIDWDHAAKVLEAASARSDE